LLLRLRDPESDESEEDDAPAQEVGLAARSSEAAAVPASRRWVAGLALATAVAAGLGAALYVNLPREPVAPTPARAGSKLRGIPAFEPVELPHPRREADPPSSTLEVVSGDRPPADPRDQRRGSPPVEAPSRVAPLPQPPPSPSPSPAPAAALEVSSPPEGTPETVETQAAAAAPETTPTFAPVHFKAKSDRLSPQAQQVVVSVAEYLREHPDVTLVLEGYADGRDSLEKNIALAERRAEAVARYLESLGLSSSRMETTSFGSTGLDRDAQESNNRVEFVLTGS
jgi:peptidoglycan-associated lipoprotein